MIIGNGISPVKTIISSGGNDADAQAFIDTAGITDGTQQAAINTLVVDLKGYSLWTKFYALYPMVGGDATKHSYNLKNTANFQITWNGGWTHASTGALPNGSNAYAQTGFVESTTGVQDDASFGFYSGTDAAGGSIDMGVHQGTIVNHIQARIAGNAFWSNSQDALAKSTTVSNGNGLIMLSRIAAAGYNKYRESTIEESIVNASNGRVTREMYLGAYNDEGVTANYSVKEHRLSFMASGMSVAEQANFSTAVTTYQTALSRNI